MTNQPTGVNRSAKNWSNVSKEKWRQARRLLIGAVRAWAGAGCSTEKATAVLAALAALDAAAGEATSAKRAVRAEKKASST
jgi:hypothetical protein